MKTWKGYCEIKHLDYKIIYINQRQIIYSFKA